MAVIPACIAGTALIGGTAPVGSARLSATDFISRSTLPRTPSSSSVRSFSRVLRSLMYIAISSIANATSASRLSGLIRIHGTSDPASIGRYASHGCIRMQNDDVNTLYPMVPVGTHVLVVGSRPASAGDWANPPNKDVPYTHLTVPTSYPV